MTSTHFTHAQNYIDRRFETAATESGALQNYAPYLLETLKALNWHGDLRTLQDALPHGATNLGFTDFLNTMAYLGYASKAIKTHKNKINAEMLPCLFVPESNIFGARGEMLIHEADLDKAASTAGTAHIFKENAAISDVIPDKTIAASNYKWFSKLLLRFKGVFKQVLIASLVINTLALVTPLFMMSVYDKVIGAHSAPTLKYLLAGAIIALAVEFSLRFLRSRSLSWFGARIDHIVSNAILDRILALPASFTERASVAAQLARLKAFESVREFFTGPLFLSFVELPFTLILLAAIAVIAGPLVVVPLVICGLYGLLLLVMNARLKALTMRMASANAARQNMHIETLGKQETLRYAGGFDPWLKRYEKISAEAAFAGYKYNQAISLIDTISQGLAVIGGIAMIYFGVERIWAGHMSMGGMIAVLILTWRTLAPLQMTCTTLPRLDQVMRNIQQINRLMDLETERDPYKAAKTIPTFTGEVEFYNVGLRYSKDADAVYAGLSFKVEPGQFVAIMGRNSTGKSTTLKLVSGLYQPQAGSIRIDGTDIRQIDPLKLRQNISYVGQEPDFFTGTIKDNFALINPNATYEEIGSAIKKAGLDTWLRSLPQGLDTYIGHNDGQKLPAAVRPQLALAMAYLQNNAIMLIDELPYEFLNSPAGEDFFNYLKKQKGKRTVLYVTYRRDFMDLADIVVQLHHDARPQVKSK